MYVHVQLTLSATTTTSNMYVYTFQSRITDYFIRLHNYAYVCVCVLCMCTCHEHTFILLNKLRILTHSLIHSFIFIHRSWYISFAHSSFLLHTLSTQNGSIFNGSREKKIGTQTSKEGEKAQP